MSNVPPYAEEMHAKLEELNRFSRKIVKREHPFNNNRETLLLHLECGHQRVMDLSLPGHVVAVHCDECHQESFK